VVREDIYSGFASTERASTEIECRFREKPISVAARQGHAAVVKLLLDHGASRHSERVELSPLFLAVESGHEEVVRRLLRAGTDIDNAAYADEKDKYCQTALSYAADNGRHGIVKLLEDCRLVYYG
jgi:ankyrin repeat protein